MKISFVNVVGLKYIRMRFRGLAIYKNSMFPFSTRALKSQYAYPLLSVRKVGFDLGKYIKILAI